MKHNSYCVKLTSLTSTTLAQIYWLHPVMITTRQVKSKLVWNRTSCALDSPNKQRVAQGHNYLAHQHRVSRSTKQCLLGGSKAWAADPASYVKNMGIKKGWCENARVAIFPGKQSGSPAEGVALRLGRTTGWAIVHKCRRFRTKVKLTSFPKRLITDLQNTKLFNCADALVLCCITR